MRVPSLYVSKMRLSPHGSSGAPKGASPSFTPFLILLSARPGAGPGEEGDGTILKFCDRRRHCRFSFEGFSTLSGSLALFVNFSSPPRIPI